jgi:membrane protein
VAGLGFSLFQVIYVWIQGNLSAYNAIYGTFAAIPLFLIWLQISWQILLFGGELSFAMQNIHDFVAEREAKNLNYDNRCKIMIATMTVVIRNWLDGGKLSTSEHIAAELGISVRTIRDVANELEEDGMVLFVQAEGSDKAYAMAPARDPHTIRFFDVISAVTGRGAEMQHLHSSPLMKRIGTTYEKIKGDVQGSGDNLLLIDLL